MKRMREPDYKLKLSFKIQTRNRWTNQFGLGARWRYFDYKKRAMASVKTAALAAGFHMRKPLQRTYIEIKSIRSYLIRDHENVDVKALIDALRYAKVIEDDDQDHLRYAVTQIQRGCGRPRLEEGTEVWIWDVSGQPPDCWRSYLQEPPPQCLWVGRQPRRSRGRMPRTRTSREPKSDSGKGKTRNRS